MTGKTSEHRMNTNSKNHYNILAAVTIKAGVRKLVDWVVLQTCTDTSLFCQFVCILLENGILSRGDILIVDNCSIHVQGDNIGLQEELFHTHGILMIALSPYHPPTELYL